MKRQTTTLAVIAAALLSGCLVSTSSTQVAEPEAERAAVAFESDRALAVFQDQVHALYADGDAELSKSSWGVPLLYGSSERTVLSENAHYNQQIARADVDADGVITEAEAATYAQVSR